MARYISGLQTEQRILEATRALVAEHGPEAITLRMICQLAGIRSGSFYNLFSSKEEVVLTVAREAISAMEPTEATLDNLTAAYARFVTETPALAHVYLHIAITGAKGEPVLRARMMRHHRRRVERFGKAILAKFPDLGEAEATRRAELLLASMQGLAILYLLEETVDFSAKVEQAMARIVSSDRLAASSHK